MDEHSKQIQMCQKDRTCTVIDRGLANCTISGNLCDRDRCPRNMNSNSNNVPVTTESSGYWVGCCGIPECAMSGEDPTFKVQIIDDIAYLHCVKCGSIRTLEPRSKLYLSGIQS